MKKVLMIQDYYYIGGIENIINVIKDNIKDYNIEILSFVNNSNKKVISLLKKNHRNFFIRNILGLFKLKKFIKKNKYDIIHIHCYNSFGLIYANIVKKYTKKVIIHAHNNEIDKDLLYIKHIINSLIKTLLKNKKYTYIAVSDECNKFCFNEKKCIIIPNGVQYEKYKFNDKKRQEYRKLFGCSKNDIVIGNIGRFEKQKNQKFIVKILNKLNSNYKLILIGEGTQKNKLKKIIKNNNLEKRVKILNYRNDIASVLNAIDIFTYPSLYEGFGISIVESQINGKYVFASEKVSKITKISNKIKYLPLNEEIWINEIINLKQKKLKLDYKLDISNFISKIKNIYEE